MPLPVNPVEAPALIESALLSTDDVCPPGVTAGKLCHMWLLGTVGERLPCDVLHDTDLRWVRLNVDLTDVVTFNTWGGQLSVVHGVVVDAEVIGQTADQLTFQLEEPLPDCPGDKIVLEKDEITMCDETTPITPALGLYRQVTAENRGYVEGLLRGLAAGGEIRRDGDGRWRRGGCRFDKCSLELYSCDDLTVRCDDGLLLIPKDDGVNFSEMLKVGGETCL